MALVVKDRVQETTTTTGTGTVTLAGAVTGFQSFSVIGDGNTTYYAIVSANNWEVGIGTYTASGTTLSRDTILESSNAGSAITLSGTSNVFCTYPAEKAIYTDASDVLNTTEINLSTLKVDGATSGTITLQAEAVAGTNTLTLPASTGNVFVTYGTAYALKGITYLTSGTSATYTTPTGVRALYVEVVGGGGGGGGVDGSGSGTAAAGRSGGGGGYSAKFITSPSASYTYTIGAGGTGGAAGANNGTSGGASSFTDGTVTLTAGGGVYGAGQNGTAGTNNAAVGGSGGTASGGDLNLSGSGGTDRAIEGGDLMGLSQSGCASCFGGGYTSGSNANADDATNYGEGGAGANVRDTTANYAGGDGYQGVIRITEFY